MRFCKRFLLRFFYIAHFLSSLAPLLRLLIRIFFAIFLAFYNFTFFLPDQMNTKKDNQLSQLIVLSYLFNGFN